MKKILIGAAFCLCAAASLSLRADEREKYLQWMQQNLIDVPEFTAWQKATGELPPDFDLLPRQNLLPEPFTFLDGSPVPKTPAGWNERRAEIKDLFERYVTGRFPARPPIDRVEILDETKGEGYRVRNVKLHFGPQSKGNVRVRLVIPDGVPGEKLPSLISTSLDGWGTQLVRRGWISVGFAGSDFMDDAAPLKELYPDYDFAALPRRAWLVQIVIDYLETLPQIDMEAIAIFGYSRDGKMATIAAAWDDRISGLVAGSTGVGGLLPWRLSGERGGGESIESTTRMFPDWLVPRLRFFSGREERLPVDANLFLAMMAPRAALVEWGYNDQVANGWGIEQAYESAREVYDWMGHPNRLGLLSVPGFHGSNDQEACVDWLEFQFGRSDKPWINRRVFPWNFEAWKAESGESVDLTKYPVQNTAAPLAGSTAEWNRKAAELRAGVEWMLGDTPPTYTPAPGGSRMRAAPAPVSVIDIAAGKNGNPGQLAPDVPAWVIAAGGQEYGWLAPAKDEVESRRIRFGGVQGDLFYPKGTPEGTKLPTVVWLHGFHYPLGYMWVYRRDLHPVLALVQAGYAVLAYDQSGFGTRYTEAGPFYDRYPHWSRMGKMVEDLHAAVTTLQGDAVVDPARISVFGFSMGGTLGLYAAAMDPRIAGVVSISGFTPMRTDTPDRGTSGATRYSHLYGLIPRLGLFAGAEERLPVDFDEVIALAAPRPVLVVSPTMDRDANPEDIVKAVNRARGVYDLYGAPLKLTLQEPNDYGRLTTATQNEVITWMKQNL
jgi:pimeloyl-ACP methyl ester carboxylesterase